MQRWTAFLLAGALAIAFVVGLFIQPLDSQANTGTDWQATFYDNSDLSGNPMLTRNDRELNFNWSSDAPAPGLPHDYFSARWIASFHFDEGDWLFSAGADGGIRLWVNDSLVIDQWSPSNTFANYTATTHLSRGIHHLKVEYYDTEGLAGVNIGWEPVIETEAVEADPAPQDTAPQTNPTPIPPGTPLAHVATGVLNVRTGPGIQFERIDQIFLYQRFPLLGQNPAGTWYLIDLKDGRSGWVAARYIYRTTQTPLPVVPFAGPTDPLAVFEGVVGLPQYRLNVRPEPNTNNDPLGIIPYEAELVVLGRSSSSIWYFVQYNDLEGWVFAPYVNLQGFPAYDLPFVD